MTRVQLFIDGFNLYHSIMNDPRLRACRWINFHQLGASIISGRESLEGVFFFTAFYPGDAAKTARHRTFIQAQDLFGVKTVIGNFRRKDKYCPLCGKTSRGYEEKETDVNMALHWCPVKIFETPLKSLRSNNLGGVLSVFDFKSVCINAFHGPSENTVKTQAWSIVCIYVLVAIVKKRLGLDQSLYTILQILSVGLFEKTPILQAFSENDPASEIHECCNQLELFNF